MNGEHVNYLLDKLKDYLNIQRHSFGHLVSKFQNEKTRPDNYYSVRNIIDPCDDLASYDKITELVNNWKNLDNNYFDLKSRKSKCDRKQSNNITNSGVFIPRHIILNDITASDIHDIADSLPSGLMDENNKLEYSQQLITDILSQLPTLSNEIKYSDSKYLSYINDKLINQLDSRSYDLYLGNISQHNDPDNELVYTISISYSNSMNVSQLINILGSQTLEQLHQSIYCIHNHINKSNDNCDTVGYFNIDNNFYLECRYIDMINENTTIPWNHPNIPQSVILTRDWLNKYDMTLLSKNITTDSHLSNSANDYANINNMLNLAANKASNMKRRSKQSINLPTDLSLLDCDISLPRPKQRKIKKLDFDMNLLTNETCLLYNMSFINISSIKFNINQKYVYNHLGCCEHTICVKSIRKYNKLVDNSDVNSYPLMTYQYTYNKRKCSVCKTWTAKYLIFYDKLQYDNPTYNCQYCYHLLHYSKNNELLYDDYLVFPYMHDLK